MYTVLLRGLLLRGVLLRGVLLRGVLLRGVLLRGVLLRVYCYVVYCYVVYCYVVYCYVVYCYVVYCYVVYCYVVYCYVCTVTWCTVTWCTVTWCYLIWKQNGKPRGDDTDMDMRATRLRFKYALRQCQFDEEQNRADALARSLHCKDTTDFWKGVRGIKDSRVPLATKVGDAVGDASITKLWQDHFSTLLNSVQNEGSKPFVCESIDRDLRNEDTIVITAPEVRECLKTIKLGKAAGLDGLAAEHFVFSHSIICVHLSLLFTSMLIHGYLSASLMKSAIVPIIY